MKKFFGFVLVLALLFAPVAVLAQTLSYDAPAFSITFSGPNAVQVSNLTGKTHTSDETSYTCDQYIQDDDSFSELVDVAKYSSPRDYSVANLDAALNGSLNGVGTVTKEYYRVTNTLNGRQSREVAALVQISDGTNLIVYLRDALNGNSTMFIEGVVAKDGSSFTQDQAEAFFNSTVIK